MDCDCHQEEITNTNLSLQCQSGAQVKFGLGAVVHNLLKSLSDDSQAYMQVLSSDRQ